MAKFWFKRIAGDITRLDEVPALWRDKVKTLIEETTVTRGEEAE